MKSKYSRVIHKVQGQHHFIISFHQTFIPYLSKGHTLSSFPKLLQTPIRTTLPITSSTSIPTSLGKPTTLSEVAYMGKLYPPLFTSFFKKKIVRILVITFF